MEKTFNKYWFEESGKESAKTLFDTVRELKQRQAYKMVNDVEWYKLYTNHAIDGFSVDKYNSVSANAGINFNIVQSITDTVVSKIGKNKPRITYLTDDGNWSLHLKAQRLEKFIDSQFQTSKVYDIMPRGLKVGCVFGSGLLKVVEKDNKPALERRLPHEIIVDERECLNDDPENLYEETYISKFVLKALYPKYAEEIEKEASEYSIVSGTKPIGNVPHHMVQVIEGWHLPSREGAKDGKHIIAIGSCALFEEVWNKPYFPFCKIDFSDRILGYWGLGISELLRGIQLNINRILHRITKSIDLGAVHRVWLEYSSKIVESQINNEVGSIHHYRGKPPIFSTPSVMPPEVFNQLDRLYNRGYELIGLSQLSAGGTKPPGLNAMVAIREYHDIETERFAMVQTSYDNAYLKCADLYTDILDDIDDRTPGGYSIKVKEKDGIKLMRWKDVKIPASQRLIQKFPTNLLPNQPSGRLDKAIELTQSGFLTREESMSLLDYPDIKSITSIKTAKLDDIMLSIDLMLNEGQKLVPQPYQNLQLGIEYCQAFYLKYLHRGVPQKNLNLLLEWIDQAGAMLEQQAQLEAEKAAAQNPPLPPQLPPDVPRGTSPEELAVLQQQMAGTPMNPGEAQIENFGQGEQL